jgi:hypothetical protein
MITALSVTGSPDRAGPSIGAWQGLGESGPSADIAEPTRLTQMRAHRERLFISHARSYFVIIGRGGAVGVGSAGESENVVHAFQPEGRSNPSNSA